ncbi:MAG: CopD family protein [Burkholderiaceae bacterium]|nr:CopD family protein [Burkholderiaceae bacterium]
MTYAALKTVHLLAIIVWVGGMVFAQFFLRPAVATLEPPLRLRLMHQVLGRFFGAVLAASLLALLSGLGMLGHAARQAAVSGGTSALPWPWTVMAVLGTLMVAIFLHIRFVLYKRLTRALGAGDAPAGGAALGRIRQWVGVNLALGTLIVVVTLLGRPL